MNKFFKITAQVVGFLIILYILLMIFLYIFVQTKDFKPILEKTFFKKTGQTLRVDGNIKLSLFPWPGIKASNIIINNPKNFPAPSYIKYFAKIGKVRVTLHMADLFHGKIHPKNVLLSNTTFNLITASSGKTNWQNLLKFSPSNNGKTTQAKASTSSNSDSMEEMYRFPIVEISNANLHFINLKTNQKTDITKLELRSPMSRKPNHRTVTMDCYIRHNNPNTFLRLFSSANIHMMPKQSMFDFQKVHFGIEWIQVKSKFKHPVVLLLNGKISIIADNFKSQMKGRFGRSDGTIELTANRQNGQINTSTTLTNLDIVPLAEILSGTSWIEGTLNATTLLNTRGDSFHQWLRNLSGHGSVKVTKGKIYGLNMALMVTKTLNQLLSGGNQPIRNDSTTTEFTSMSADFSVSGGIVRTNNFLLDAKQLKATGKGKVNLPDTTIDAKLLTTYANNSQWQLPLEITGNLTNPKIQPDTAAIAQKVLKNKLQKDVGDTLDKVKKQFDKLF